MATKRCIAIWALLAVVVGGCGGEQQPAGDKFGAAIEKMAELDAVNDCSEESERQALWLQRSVFGPDQTTKKTPEDSGQRRSLEQATAALRQYASRCAQAIVAKVNGRFGLMDEIVRERVLGIGAHNLRPEAGDNFYARGSLEYLLKQAAKELHPSANIKPTNLATQGQRDANKAQLGELFYWYLRDPCIEFLAMARAALYEASWAAEILGAGARGTPYDSIERELASYRVCQVAAKKAFVMYGELFNQLPAQAPAAKK